jgi:hypothetical protein
MRAALLGSVFGLVIASCGHPTVARGPLAPVTTPDTVPATAPDTVPAWIHSNSNIVWESNRSPFPFVKDLVIVLFAPSAPQVQRQAAIDAVHGRVIGGMRLNGVDGFYFVSLPPDSTHARVFEAVIALKAMAGVGAAIPDYLIPMSAH